MRILLVEDNRPLSEWLARTLRDDNYSIDCVYDGAAADHLLCTQSYALVVLDMDLPKLGGREVLRRLRNRGDNVAVLILTADGRVQKRVEGLNDGADDYLVKPFEVSELEARVRALLRRASGQRNPVLQCGSLLFDSNSRQFSLAGRPLALTPREHALLETLIREPGRTVSKSRLADSLFDMDDSVTLEAIEVYIYRLRKKLEGEDVGVFTLRGLGYMLKTVYG
ncbi:response regulator [Neisseriaceae bacterium JH1-16]|nr:response regulator [Neisseriaceae bacterium JH1-16]